MMPEKLSAGACKTCKAKTQPGERRCDKHEAEFRQWLAGGEPAASRSEYKPRFNGVIGLYEGEITRQMHASRGRVRISRGLRAGQELKFD
jgi:hypothetical protein